MTTTQTETCGLGESCVEVNLFIYLLVAKRISSIFSAASMHPCVDFATLNPGRRPFHTGRLALRFSLTIFISNGIFHFHRLLLLPPITTPRMGKSKLFKLARLVVVLLKIAARMAGCIVFTSLSYVRAKVTAREEEVN